MSKILFISTAAKSASVVMRNAYRSKILAVFQRQHQCDYMFIFSSTEKGSGGVRNHPVVGE